MKENSVISFKNPDQLEDPLTDLLRTGAKQLIHQFVEAELAELLEQHQHQQHQQHQQHLTKEGKQSAKS